VSFEPKPTDFAPIFPDVMTEAQAASFLQRSQSTLKKQRLAGKVPHLPTKPITYLRVSLLEYLSRIEVRPDFMLEDAGASDDATTEEEQCEDQAHVCARPTRSGDRETYRDALDL
jgi:hypothetical protein